MAPWRWKNARIQDDPHYQSPTTGQETICGESAFREGRGSQKYAKKYAKKRAKRRAKKRWRAQEVGTGCVQSTGDWGSRIQLPGTFFITGGYRMMIAVPFGAGNA
jgi:hypothetical protein